MTSLLTEAIQVLRESGIPNAAREAQWLLEAAGPERFLELARRRIAGEPLQYLTGRAGFRTIEIAVGPGVFIPRPETEVTAEVAMGRLPEGGTVVEIGTGSGAIALAFATERPDAHVIATELSSAAVKWAEKNRVALGSRIELFHGDLFEPLDDALRGEIDVVVSNPPYIARRDHSSLPPEVVGHEPHDALFAGVDGLTVLHRLAEETRGWLCPGGWLVTEIGETQGEEVSELLTSVGFGEVNVDPDLTGRDRVVSGRWLS